MFIILVCETHKLFFFYSTNLFFPPQTSNQPFSWSLASGFLWLLYLREILSFSDAQWNGWKLCLKELYSTWFRISKFTIKELFSSLLRARTTFSKAQLLSAAADTCKCQMSQVLAESINASGQYETRMAALVSCGVSVHHLERTWPEHLCISDNNVKLIEWWNFKEKICNTLFFFLPYWRDCVSTETHRKGSMAVWCWWSKAPCRFAHGH